MAAFLTRMPSGIPGDLTRQSAATVEPQPLASATPFATYGAFGYMTAAGAFAPIITTTTVGQVYGLLVRPFPTTGINASDPLGTSVPPTTGIANVLRRGYINVTLAGGTAYAGLQVYVRTVVGTSGHAIGAIEAAPSDTANCLAISNCFFTGPADASGNVEIGYNI
ncbi:MAG: hypothetical protein KGH75_02400 [Rhodospirillales bacterium]|nr:hypothetical protein [Rhodospirillales bacterium]